MAESNRRGEDAAEEHVDDVFDDAIDDDASDAEDDAPAGRSRSAAATKARPKAEEKKSASRSDGNVITRFFAWIGGIPGRIWRFLLEVVSELRKVIWPTRKDLLTYTAVVVVFVTIMLTVVGTIDVAFAKVVLFVFGNS
ncbi:preprotein translocase subunit SecE [Allocatelliglobosispora scoriae]|uniref:Protein translocase subunit SecE n=1 Tax=Allocatelliglobosispora scoriae TaxID=643052 RepID=A0A841BT19_9ACTN|nr:preprotein translocase subunit SecE [Allocatelliglobosispora scoriae]MBB5870548.1 preprotein translocase subunit SecE [Allocatelliglobosispora scoriae]